MYTMKIICKICGEALGEWTRPLPWTDENIEKAKNTIRCIKCTEMTSDDIIVSEVPNE
jgi:hypothetical protein